MALCLSAVMGYAKSNVALLIGYDDINAVEEQQERAALDLFRSLHPDGLILTPTTLPAAELSGVDCIWVHIDRTGLAHGWQNLPAPFIESKVLDRLKAFHTSGGNLLLTKQANQLIVPIGRVDAKFAPGIYGAGDGGRGTDVWCIQAQIGYLYGVPGTPEYQRDPSQYYDRRQHPIYRGLRTMTWVNGVFSYETFPMLGTGNGTEMHREDHNCMWDFNAYNGVYASEGKNPVERFEKDNNALVLGQWGHVMDHAVGGIVEFLPQGGSGSIMAIGLALYELSPRAGEGLGTNGYADNIRLLTQNSLDHYAMHCTSARIITSDNLELPLTLVESRFEARNVTLSNPAQIHLNALMKGESTERACYTTITDANYPEKRVPHVPVAFTVGNAVYSLTPDALPQHLYLPRGRYDFIFDDVKMTLAINSLGEEAPSVPSDLPSTLYLLGDPIQVGDFNMSFWDVANRDVPLTQVAGKPGVYRIGGVSLGNGGFRFTDGQNAYVSDVAHLEVAAGIPQHFNLRKYSHTDDNFVASGYDRAKRYTIILNLIDQRLTLLPEDYTFAVSSSEAGYERVENGEADVHLFVPRPSPADTFDAVSQTLSINLGASRLQHQVEILPDGWAFAHNPNHPFMGDPYAVTHLNEQGEHEVTLHNMRPGAYTLQVTLEGAVVRNIPVHLCYSPLGFALSGATVTQSNDAYTYTCGEFWPLGGSQRIYVGGHEYMRGKSTDTISSSLYLMWYRFTPATPQAAYRMNALASADAVEYEANGVETTSRGVSACRKVEMLSGFTKHDDTHLTLQGLTAEGGTLEIYMQSNGAMNPRPYVVTILPQQGETITGLESVSSDIDVATAPEEYYTLQGLRVSPDSLHPGIYIVRRGMKTFKIQVN